MRPPYTKSRREAGRAGPGMQVRHPGQEAQPFRGPAAGGGASLQAGAACEPANGSLSASPPEAQADAVRQKRKDLAETTGKHRQDGRLPTGSSR